MASKELIPHLFRTEAGKMTSVLSKLFSLEHVHVAEDIVSETFLLALEVWPYKGMPENPVAWLYTVAKNKAKNELSRNKVFAQKVAELANGAQEDNEFTLDLSDANISDSQLQMLFALCHPSIPVESQIGLSLRILCGFGIDEIATAFLTNKETINKRLFRAREKLREENVVIELPAPAEIARRIDTVLQTLYLLFNEGYYSESHDKVLRQDLCLEAMRLTELLVNSETTNSPKVNALLALMYFHASRFAARTGENGELILYDEQEERRWNQEFISRGAFYLHEASQGKSVSTFHLEATIAYWHTIKNDSREKWESILQLYNQLLLLQYSPVAALNRTYALSKVKGTLEAITEAEKLQLNDNPYYFTLLGKLYADSDRAKAAHYYEEALRVAKTEGDRKLISKKLLTLRSPV
jgi:RNA polymerase sigma factor (sigma-70 family)